MEALSCLIPSTTFVSAVYGLNWGDSVYAKVVAYNVYGPSNDSPLSNPTVLMTNPDPPINLIENTALRSFTQIALVWDDGVSNKGSSIVNYVVSIAQGANSVAFTVLENESLVKNYVATGLTVGVFYRFKVQARNAFGLSDYSNTLTQICAFVPTAPQMP